MLLCRLNHIGGIRVSVLAASAVNRGFETRSDKTKDYEIFICGFSTKPAALRRKRKEWSTRKIFTEMTGYCSRSVTLHSSPEGQLAVKSLFRLSKDY
jgi:hypothetical protein